MSIGEDIIFEYLHMEIVNVVAGREGIHNKDLIVSKLEKMGHRVGQGMIDRFTKDSPRFKDELDIMKFICKDFWTAVFKKQVDNLRTNHQGVYVLLDKKFRLLTHLSSEKEYVEIAPKFIAFSCGLIRGALSNFGLISIVTADVNSLPECRFQVQIHR
ncbi:DgyrCDS2364 [Dimorphilus gyrociliatus]|uniref:Trafficking protein particle complex subunit 6B n=1 Tax=Dimorphilus gyrociliatus TaxID=2664684 RepID=A0A7I8VCU9_9ANNE|nr:DgyrCDS2364 [Dimorphilus gyrociliatus]